MARGRKPQLATANNVQAIPLHDEPQSVHFARAAELRPDWLTENELKIWDRYAPQLAMLGRLKPHFVDAIAELCIVRCRLFDARKLLDEQERHYVSETRNGTQYKSRPEVAQLNDDWRKWRNLVGEFGLAPASERGMKSSNSEISDDFDKL